MKKAEEKRRLVAVPDEVWRRVTELSLREGRAVCHVVTAALVRYCSQESLHGIPEAIGVLEPLTHRVGDYMGVPREPLHKGPSGPTGEVGPVGVRGPVDESGEADGGVSDVGGGGATGAGRLDIPGPVQRRGARARAGVGRARHAATTVAVPGAVASGSYGSVTTPGGAGVSEAHPEADPAVTPKEAVTRLAADLRKQGFDAKTARGIAAHPVTAERTDLAPDEELF